MSDYKEEFPVGSRVRIRPRSELASFARSWQYHHPLEQEQLQFGGEHATVENVYFYHGGDALYRLTEIPGIWHEQCLEKGATT